MRIEKVKLNQIKQIAKLYEKEMSREFRKVGEEPITAKKYEKVLKNNLKKSQMLVLLDNKLIIGFIWCITEKNEINIEEIFITQKGKGYGNLLMKKILSKAEEKKIKRINVDIHYNNKNAINFFRKSGFIPRTIEMSREVKWLK